MKNRKVLVTGAAGFVGSVLVGKLLKQGYKVVAYDNLMFGIESLFGYFSDDDFQFVEGSVCDHYSYAGAVDGCGAVIHLAAYVGYPICKKNPDQASAVNAVGTRVVAEWTPDGVPLIFASTGSCYGNIEGLCTEDSLLKPLTIYGKTKVVAERAIQEFHSDHVIYRFATGYGTSPRLRLDLMVNDFCYKAVREKNLIVYEGYNKRTFIHVSDMARSFIFALENFDQMNSQVFNVGSNHMNYSKRDIAELIYSKTKYYLHYADFGKDEDQRDYEVSYDKIQSLGFEVQKPLEIGIEELVNLFQSFELKNKFSNV